MGYKQLYNECVLEKCKLIIIDKDSVINDISNVKNYQYKLKHHDLSDESAEKLTNLLIDNVLFYTYGADEIVSKFANHEIPNELRDLAKYSFSERLAKRWNASTDGLIGELMLDILIQEMFPSASKIFTRAKYVQQRDNCEIKGYDAVYFINNDGQINMLLGQSKAGSESYCKFGIKSDLNTKYLDGYFCDSVRYMCDKLDEGKKDSLLLSIIENINAMIYKSHGMGLDNTGRKNEVEKGIMNILADNKVQIIIPCLLMFKSEIYYANAKNFEVELKEEALSMIKHFEDKIFNMQKNLSVKIVFILLPIKDVDKIRQNLVGFKKEVQ